MKSNNNHPTTQLPTSAASPLPHIIKSRNKFRNSICISLTSIALPALILTNTPTTAQTKIAALPTIATEAIFNNEASDTTRITKILIEESQHPDRGNVARIAELFIGTTYAAGTLETPENMGDIANPFSQQNSTNTAPTSDQSANDGEALRINLDAMDCTTFVETVLAIAYTAGEGRQAWHDFIYNLRRIRYRNGTINGYTSRLHYISDWILDNSSRGILREITNELPGVRYNIKSLDYMTAHRNSYPALANQETYQRMKNVEAGFSNYRYPLLKANSIKIKELTPKLRDGDIVAITTTTRGLDVSHLGILKIIDGTPRFIHASSKAGTVILDPLPLTDYLRRNRSEGIRIIRLSID